MPPLHNDGLFNPGLSLFISIDRLRVSGVRGTAPGGQFPWYEGAGAANPHKHWIPVAKCVRFLTSLEFWEKAYMEAPCQREKAYVRIGFPGRNPL